MVQGTTSNSPANSRVSNEEFMSRTEFKKLLKFWQDRINNGNNQGRNVQNTSRTKESFAETEKPIENRKAEIDKGSINFQEAKAKLEEHFGIKKSTTDTRGADASDESRGSSKAQLTDSRFRNVHGGIFKKLKSVWICFCASLGVKSAKNARANNVKDFSEMVDFLKSKYGEECIPQSLKDKLADITENGRSAVVTHGTLERAEKLIE